MSTAEHLPTGDARSTGLSFQKLLDTDTREAPRVLRLESPLELGPVRVPVERYTTREFHDLEVEKLWSRVWQMACREEQIAEVGDHVVYDIADYSILVVRSAPDRIQAFHNACLHRGRQLREEGGRADEFRCPFHGWTWSLEGQLKHVPCRWDFPDVTPERNALPEVKTGTWGGFVFVNLDPDCAPLADHLGDLPQHFERWPLEKRFTAAHVGKRLLCNWKVAQEAFMEAYHVVATHPQLLAGIGDANSQYDAWDTFSRAITANATPSPHIDWEPSEQEKLDAMMARYEDQGSLMHVSEAMNARALAAAGTRMQLQATVPDAHLLTDAECIDSFYYTVFPNFHPWGAYNRIVYRFRPWRNDPHSSLMEVYFLSPFRGRRPKPAAFHMLGEDEDWTRAPELGFLARVFNQDTFNLPKVQKGLRATQKETLQFARYQETKLRHFHLLLERQLAG